VSDCVSRERLEVSRVGVHAALPKSGGESRDFRKQSEKQVR
jgi:hypothetical protein